MDVPSFHITIMEKEEEAGGDLWQDCLALLIMDPSNVRQMIVDNYGGVRIDGTNATIIGNKQGEIYCRQKQYYTVSGWIMHSGHL